MRSNLKSAFHIDFVEVFLSALVALLISIFVGIGSFMVGVLVTGTGDGYEVESHTFEIVAASDSTLGEGRFYLFGGSYNEVPQYFYYRQNDGYITQGHVPTNKTRVYEVQENAGEVKVIGTECRDWTLWQVGMNANPFVEDGTLENCGSRRYEIRVPEGTVVREFNLDLQK